MSTPSSTPSRGGGGLSTHPSQTQHTSPTSPLVRQASLRTAAPVRRAASGRAAGELRCQNAECVCVLETTSIPVDYDTILQRLFGSPPPAPPLDLRLFKEAAARGDAATFTVLVAESARGLAEDDRGGALPGGWPYCDDCVEDLLKAWTRRAADAVKRRDGAILLADIVSGGGGGGEEGIIAAAITFESEAEQKPEPPVIVPVAETGTGGGGLAAPAQVLATLLIRETAARARLLHARTRLDAAALARARIASKRKSVCDLTNRLWLTNRDLSLRLSAGRERMGALSQRASRFRATLGALRALRTFSDAFFLWYSDPFATINGARLGRAPSAGVGVPEWPEVNAALGQFTTLLAETARRLGAPRLRWVLIPCGSYSKITTSEDARAAPHELYYNGSFFGASRFTAALRALVAALGELGAAVEAADPAFRLPYAITTNGEKCGGASVSLGRDVPWTRALRCAAANLKWLVAWSLKREANQRD